MNLKHRSDRRAAAAAAAQLEARMWCEQNFSELFPPARSLVPMGRYHAAHQACGGRCLVSFSLAIGQKVNQIDAIDPIIPQLINQVSE